MLRNEEQFEHLAQSLSKARDVLYLGRGINYPIALEGALKLKEISYIHAEGYAAGELKHGPIALIDENVPVIVVAPDDDLLDKTISNVQEVAARGGQIILISSADAERAGCKIVDPHQDAQGACIYQSAHQRRADPAHRLPHGRLHGDRRRSAPQSRQVRDRGMRGKASTELCPGIASTPCLK